MALAEELFTQSMDMYDVTLPSGEHVAGSDFVVNEALRSIDPNTFGKALAMSVLRGAHPDALTGQGLIDVLGYGKDYEGKLAGESLVRALVFGGLVTIHPELSEHDSQVVGLEDFSLHPVDDSSVIDIATSKMSRTESIKFAVLYSRTPQYREVL